jgi:5,10-methylene-tetrahydrofolate dehydrogenase/methenyl tetrahydrofolate cyclohydrolase
VKGETSFRGRHVRIAGKSYAAGAWLAASLEKQAPRRDSKITSCKSRKDGLAHVTEQYVECANVGG